MDIACQKVNSMPSSQARCKLGSTVRLGPALSPSLLPHKHTGELKLVCGNCVVTIFCVARAFAGNATAAGAPDWIGWVSLADGCTPITNCPMAPPHHKIAQEPLPSHWLAAEGAQPPPKAWGWILRRPCVCSPPDGADKQALLGLLGSVSKKP